MKKIFGKRLKELRVKNDEMQSDLATILKVDISAISQWENGRYYPKVEKLIEIAYHYQTSTDYLLGINDNTYEFEYKAGNTYLKHTEKHQFGDKK